MFGERKKGHLSGKTHLGRILAQVYSRAALSGFLEVSPPFQLCALSLLHLVLLESEPYRALGIVPGCKEKRRGKTRKVISTFRCGLPRVGCQYLIKR